MTGRSSQRFCPWALFLCLFITFPSIPADPKGVPEPKLYLKRQSATLQNIEALIAQLDSNRFLNTITTLAGWNRYTNNPEIINARNYIQGEFQSLGLTNELQSFTVGSTTAYNIIATLPGTTHSDEWYIVCGHYDSISENVNAAAPGAEDNGSGTAGVLELARVLADEPQAATIKFIAFSGEELGLFGSTAYVQSLMASGDLSKIKGVINMDMISYTADSDLDVLIETKPLAQSIIDSLQLSASVFTTLRVVTSLNPCCSDHMPFLNNNVKAVLTIENDWDIYPHYHRTTDTVNNITPVMGMEILKMNLATLVQLMSGAISGITVSSPNGGQNWETGTTQTISWSSTGSVDNLKIELSRDGGSTYELLVASTPNDGQQPWTVTGPMTSNAKIRISDITDSTVSDSSDQVFTISDSSPPPPPPPGACSATKLLEGDTDGPYTLDLLHRFRDEVLATTARGRKYSQWFYQFSPEIISLLTSHPQLLMDSQTKLGYVQPLIQSLVNFGGVTITRDDLETVDSLLRAYATKATPAFGQALEQLRRDIHDPDVQWEFGVRMHH